MVGGIGLGGHELQVWNIWVDKMHMASGHCVRRGEADSVPLHLSPRKRFLDPASVAP